MASLSQFATNGGIGLGGIEKAKAAGWTTDQINAAIKAEGLTAGEAIRAQGYGGGSSSGSSGGSSSGPGYIPAKAGASQQFMGANSTPGSIGLESVNKMRAAGYSDYDIMAQINMDGLKMGEAALKSLKGEVDAGSGQSYNYNQYQGGTMGNVFIAGPNQITDMMKGQANATPGFIGMETVNKLKSQGMSDEWIRRQAGIEGLKFGSIADQSLSKETWQDRNARTLDQRLAQSNSTPASTLGATMGFETDKATQENQNSADNGLPRTPIDAEPGFYNPMNDYGSQYIPSETEADDPWSGTAFSAASEPVSSFKPAPLPRAAKKPSIFEQVMNAAPKPTASPQTFSNVIASI